jgi:large subunit ribosomal protein L15
LAQVEGNEITPDSLHEAGLVSHSDGPIKILGDGEPDRAFTVRRCAVSKSAGEKITKAGGTIEA